MIFERCQRFSSKGTPLVFRTLEKSDAGEALAFLKKMYSESSFLACYPEEVVITPEQEEEFISRMNASPDSIFIAATLKEKIVGTIQVARISTRIKLRHRGELAIAVLSEYQGEKIASLLMQFALEKAREMKISQVELEVVGENEKAVRLYEKFGFKKYGETPAGMILKDGTRLDLVRMIRFLD